LSPSTYKYRLRSKKILKNSKLVVYFMYHILNFYTIIFQFYYPKINYKMVKCGMVVLTGKEKADVAVDWML
jgi:hypothetical protein